jgi:hypothetical protein
MSETKTAPELALLGGEGTSDRCTDEISRTESCIQDNSRFDWANDPAIVIKRQPAIAIYVNCRGELVIRQEAGIGFDEDECVFVRPDHVVKLIGALRALHPR